jgi:hypothetical protein
MSIRTRPPGQTVVLWLATFTAVLAVGCAGRPSRPLDASALSANAGRSIGLVASEMPPFIARTVAKSQLGLLGVGLMAAAGNEIVRDNHIPDPSYWFGTRLTTILGDKHGLIVQRPTLLSGTGDDAHWSTTLVLHVTTKDWGMVWYRDAFFSYGVFYKATLTLRDSRNGRVLASGDCDVPQSEDSTGAPGYDDMLANGAALLKAKLYEAAEFCTRKYARELFGNPLPEPLGVPALPPVDPKVVYAPCHLENDAAWQAADADGKRRMLEACHNQRRGIKPPPPLAPAPPVVTPPLVPRPPSEDTAISP